MPASSWREEVLHDSASDPSVRDHTGCGLMIAMVSWLGEILGLELTPPLQQALERAQSDLLLLMQREDDALDGQAQTEGARDIPLAAIRDRLEEAFPAHSPFWTAFHALADEQRRSARWEIEHRGARGLPFDEDLFRALARKGALLRWPAWGVAQLAGRPGRAKAMDDLFERFLGVAILFDDLRDFEDDWDRGQVNAVLCAGRVESREPLHFYSHAALGAALVCRKAQGELLRIVAEVPGTALSRFCESRARRCRTVAAIATECCRIRSLDHVLRGISAALGGGRRAGPQASGNGSSE
jgi:hypothetical protein